MWVETILFRVPACRNMMDEGLLVANDSIGCFGKYCKLFTKSSIVVHLASQSSDLLKKSLSCATLQVPRLETLGRIPIAALFCMGVILIPLLAMSAIAWTFRVCTIFSLCNFCPLSGGVSDLSSWSAFAMSSSLGVKSSPSSITTSSTGVWMTTTAAAVPCALLVPVPTLITYLCLDTPQKKERNISNQRYKPCFSKIFLKQTFAIRFRMWGKHRVCHSIPRKRGIINWSSFAVVLQFLALSMQRTCSCKLWDR